MLEHIRNELKDPMIPSVATGGLSTIIKPLENTFTSIQPNLTLDGLRITGSYV
jgi:pantothenate kinase type III